MKNEGEKIKCDHSRILIVFSVKGVENMTATSRSTSDEIGRASCRERV